MLCEIGFMNLRLRGRFEILAKRIKKQLRQKRGL